MLSLTDCLTVEGNVMIKDKDGLEHWHEVTIFAVIIPQHNNSLVNTINMLESYLIHKISYNNIIVYKLIKINIWINNLISIKIISLKHLSVQPRYSPPLPDNCQFTF